MADANLPHVPLGRNVPRFWTWNAPKGRAANNPYIVKMVRIQTSLAEGVPDGYTPPPTEWPQGRRLGRAIADWVEYRELKSHGVCILLQNFGADSVNNCVLGLNEDDSITDGTNVSVNTIFTAYGKAECKAFFEDFAEEYAYQQTIRPGVTSPSRFHMDSESMPSVTGGTGPNGWELFIFDDDDWAEDHKPWDVQLADDRADNEGEQLYGGTEGSNLSALWSDVESDYQFFTSKANWWTGGEEGTYGVSKWYFGIAGRVAEEAMHVSCYEVARDTWPGVLCSNYESSLASSVVHKQLSRREHTDLEFYHEGIRADMQAPVCYSPFKEWQDVWTGVELSRSDSWFYHSRKLLEAGFYTATPAHPLSPWLQNIGQLVGLRKNTEGTVIDPGYRANKTDLHRLCQQSWQFGAREFLIWDDNSPSDDDWEALSNLAYRLANETCHRPRSPGRGRGR